MKRILAIFSVILLCACTTEQQYSTQYPCNFVFITQIYPTSKLTAAVKNVGAFVIVSPKVRNGAYSLMITPNDGTDEEECNIIGGALEVEELNQRYTNMGARNQLVIGKDTYGTLRAFDSQCPNCIIKYGKERYPMKFTDNGLFLFCPNCERVYDINTVNGPVVENGQQGDRSLIEYRISFPAVISGYECLHVHN